MNRYCQKHGIVPSNHKCGRWARGGTRRWRNERAAAMVAAGGMCTEPGCGARAVEVHHVTGNHVRAVCFAHNPRGG